MPSVLITGCSAGGIGYALAKEYTANGYTVIATTRKVSSMAGLEKPNVHLLALDVTDTASVKAAKEEVIKITGGTLDILVNNAGQTYTIPAVDIELDKARKLFEVNVFGVMLMVQEFAPLVIAAKGKIVNNTSVLAVFPAPWTSIYNSSKAALQMYTSSLRTELKPFGVDVITLVTGGVKSNIYTYDPDLLPNSIYQPVNDQFIKTRQNDAGMAGAQDVEVYARTVVAKTIKPHPPSSIWAGNYATRIWFFWTILSTGLLEWMAAGYYGMDKLAPRLAALKKTT